MRKIFGACRAALVVCGMVTWSGCATSLRFVDGPVQDAAAENTAAAVATNSSDDNAGARDSTDSPSYTSTEWNRFEIIEPAEFSLQKAARTAPQPPKDQASGQNGAPPPTTANSHQQSQQTGSEPANVQPVSAEFPLSEPSTAPATPAVKNADEIELTDPVELSESQAVVGGEAGSGTADKQPTDEVATTRSEESEQPEHVAQAESSALEGDLTPPKLADEAIKYDVAMSIEEALQYARQNHPLLISLDREVTVARADVIEARTRENPQFRADADTALDQDGATEIQFRVQVPFHTAGKLRRRQAAALATVRTTAMARYVDEFVILLDAVDAASEVLYLRQLARVQSELYELAQRQADAIPSDLAPSRSGPRVTGKIDAQVAAMELQTEQRQTVREWGVAQVVFARSIGAPPDMKIDLTDPLEIEYRDLLPLETVKQIAAQRSPEYTQAVAAMNEQHQFHLLAHAEGIPDLTVGTQYSEERDAEGEKHFRLLLTSDVPIFDRNQGEKARTAAQLQVERANMQLGLHNSVGEAVALYEALERLRVEARELEQRNAWMQARYEAFFSNPTVRDVIPAAQAFELEQQLLQQELVDLELRYQFVNQQHRLQVLIGRPIVALPGEVTAVATPAPGQSGSGGTEDVPAVPQQ